MGRKKKEKLENLELFKYLSKESKSNKNKGMIKALINLKEEPAGWRGLLAVPPCSCLEKILRAFEINTDIPLEIPFFAAIHFISAWLLKQEVVINVKGQIVRPDLWTVILAESGSGKTFVTSILKHTCTLDIDAGIGEVASAAKFVEELRDHNKSIWIKDEFAQLLKAISNLGHMQEMKDYLLKTYDGEKIERKTKKEVITIENPVISILGLTVKSTFLQNVSVEDMLDGQAQRFVYVLAEADPNRPITEYPIYDYEQIVCKMHEAWEQIRCMQISKEYHVSEAGLEAFKTAFKLMFKNYQEIDKSFYRRILWRAIKYALIYHIVLGKESDEIDDIDMTWSSRLTSMHLKDAKWLLVNHGMSELEKVVSSAERLKAKFESLGKTLTARDLIANVSAIRSIKEAQVIMSFI